MSFIFFDCVPMQVEPVLQAMEDVLGSLTQTLDGRVYVAMGRGLWDFTAREIYEYADELAESKENQVNICSMPHRCQDSL